MIVFTLAMVLFLVGLYGVLVKRNIFKIIIGLSIIEYAVNLLFALIGYRQGGAAPIRTFSTPQDMLFVDPIPQALVLTAIVIGLATTALIAAVAVRIYEKYDTFDVRKIRKLRG
jgi:multicomponent Na+:H+ antiporter subunit C